MTGVQPLVLFCKWDEHGPEALARRGAELVMLVSESDTTWMEPSPLVTGRTVATYQVTSLDCLEELEAVLVDLDLRGLPITHVTSSSEAGQYAAGHLAARLGLDADAPERAAASRDKRRMKQRAGHVGVCTATFASLLPMASEVELAAVVDRVGLPCIVKPSNGQATLGTRRVETLEELRTLVGSYQGALGAISKHLVAEELVVGDEYHVDAVWRDGEPWVFAISRYFCPRLQLMDEEHPPNGAVLLPEEEHPELYARVRAMHHALNKALLITRGPTHLEFFHRRDTDELVFSEVAVRPGGACIPATVGARFGADIYDAAALELLDGNPDQMPWHEPPAPYVGWVNLAPSRSGRIKSMPLESELLELPGVLEVHYGRRPGESVSTGWVSNWCLMLIVAGASEEELSARVAGLLLLADRIVLDA